MKSPKSILWKKSKPATSNQTPKKKKKPAKAATTQDANSNITVCGSKKKQLKKHCVSFELKKGGQGANLCK